MSKKFFFLIFFAFLSMQQGFSSSEEKLTLKSNEKDNISLVEEKAFEERPVYMEAMPYTKDYRQSFFRMLISLAAIIALLFVTFWALRRLMRGKMNQANQSKSIKILEKRALSQKTMLYLIEMEKEKILLAESHLDVRPIHVKGEKKTLESFPKKKLEI